MVETIEFVAVDGAVLRTARQGGGPAVVLAHGGPGMWDYLGPVAAMLDDRATVYRYDQRACGRSSGHPRYDLATAVADLDALRTHWGLGDWVVGGHSFGATLALAYALRHPARTRGLLYLCGTGIGPAWRAEYRANRAARLGPDGERLRAEYQALLARAQGAEFAALRRAASLLTLATDLADQSQGEVLAHSIFLDGVDVNDEVNDEVNEFLGADAARFAEDPALPDRLRALAVPTLVVHGEADPRPAWAARRVAELPPKAQYRLIRQAGHFPWLERPAAFAELVQAFLAAR
jgi:proline iminopeptidase